MSGADNKHSRITSGRKIFFTKVAIVLLTIILQIAVIFVIYNVLRSYVIYWRTIAFLLSAIVVLYIVNKQDNPAYKLAWIILVLTFPLVGGLLYIALAGNRTRVKFINSALENYLDTFKYYKKDDMVRYELSKIDKSAGVQADYISQGAGYPVYKNTLVKYFPTGEMYYAQLLKELEKSTHFIFMEYFIFTDGKMWNEIFNILKKKATQGVDIRIIYDDLGSSLGLPSHFMKRLQSYGIKVKAFNKIAPVLSLGQNNRDHRKIVVVDGNVAFTGGINIADEYINAKVKHGHWKDSGVMLKGEAVWSFTVMFLQMWKFLTKEKVDYLMFSPYRYNKERVMSAGYVLPYGDTPVDENIVGENIYLNIINKAKRYVYIMTPYLIIDNEMITALTLAAQSGIDVRIVVPGIPDKKMVYLVTQSYFKQLILAGVKIYKYKKGFVHAKNVIADDELATVGTINFDYRSLYLHFECGVWMYGISAINDIKEDFIKTFEVCEKIEIDDKNGASGLNTILQGILKAFAPLM